MGFNSAFKGLKTDNNTIQGTLRGDQYQFFTIARSFLLRNRNVSDKICRENQDTLFVFSDFFYQTSCCL